MLWVIPCHVTLQLLSVSLVPTSSSLYFGHPQFNQEFLVNQPNVLSSDTFYWQHNAKIKTPLIIADYRPANSKPSLDSILKAVGYPAGYTTLPSTQTVDEYCDPKATKDDYCKFALEINSPTGEAKFSYVIRTLFIEEAYQGKNYDLNAQILMKRVDEAFVSLVSPDLALSIANSTVRAGDFMGIDENDYAANSNLETWEIGGLATTIFVVGAFLNHISFLVQRIVEEKENRIKEGLQIMGLTSYAMVQGLVLTSFGFFLSVLFNRSTIAGPATSSLIFAVSVMSYILFSNISGSFGVVRYILSIFVAPVGFVAQISAMIFQESIQKSYGFSNLFQNAATQGVSYFGILICQILNIAFNLFMTWYVDTVFPGEYGTPQPWNFLFNSAYWSKTVKTSQSSLLNSEPVYGSHVLIQPQSKEQEVTLQIRNLSKTYTLPNGSELKAVDGLSFDLYEGQVLAFLGRNGSGKSTTIGMLTGLFPATSGDAFFFRDNQTLSLQENLSSIRESLGVCPQHDWLWNQLSVRQTLEVYAGLKGISKENIEEVIAESVRSCDLVEKKENLVSSLSGGQRRKLSLAIAFMGNSKYVFLDEMSSGVDPLSRRAMWKMVSENKAGRTIILTTHFMDEADILGDNVVILSQGEVCGIGSSMYLKNESKLGFEVIISQSTSIPTNIEQSEKLWLEFIQKYAADTTYVQTSDNEVSYRISAEHKDKLSKLFRSIEEHKVELGIGSYGYSGTSLQDVFMKITADNEKRRNPDVNLNSKPSVDVLLNPMVDVVANRSGQLKALLWKRAKIAKSDLVSVLIPFAVILLAAIAIYIAGSGSKAECDLSFKKLVHPKIKFGNGTIPKKLFPVHRPLKSMDSALLSKSQMPVFDTVTNLNEFLVKNRYDVLGSIAFQNASSAWSSYVFSYNSNFFSASYETMNLAHTSLLNSFLNTKGRSIDSSIQFLNQFKKPVFEDSFDSNGHTVMFILLLSLMLYVPLYSTIHVTKERLGGTKQQQLFSGLTVPTYYLSNILWDTVMIIVASILVTLSLSLSSFWNGNIITTFLTLFFYGLSVTLFGYLIALYAKSSAGAVSLVVGYLAFLSFVSYISAGAYLTPVVDDYYMWRTIWTAVNPLHSIINLYWLGANAFLSQCQMNDGKLFDFGRAFFLEPFVGTIGVLVGQSIVLWFLLMRLESQLVIGDTIFEPVEGEEEEDISSERKRIMDTKDTPTDKVSIQGLSKDFNKSYGPRQRKAVINVSVGIRDKECFGLLGVNGAGKTTTLRMVSGQEKPSAGTVIVDGKNIFNDVKSVQKNIGVCNQFDSVFASLTIREHLYFYSSLRGFSIIPDSDVVEYLISKLDLSLQADKKASQLSGGNQRKLSFAITLIGNPPVMIFDEPSTGMDPVSKLFVWDVLKDIRKRHAVILTTHAMEEVAAVCNRVGIMVAGKLVALGNQQHLKNKFGKSLQIQVMTRTTSEQIEFSKYVQTVLKQVTILEQCQTSVNFSIPTDPLQNGGYLLSDIFDLFEDFKDKFNIYFEISQTTLEQVFIRFAEIGETMDQEAERLHEEKMNRFRPKKAIDEDLEKADKLKDLK
ncbi:hypothetical protein HDV02_003633 [Globomyces sp. JEL0801]|nr:hypothetical protein HDV02_003633 [Globomyces sp. JEL0801]